MKNTRKIYTLGMLAANLCFSVASLWAYEQSSANLPDQFEYSLSGLKESMTKLEEGNAAFNLQISAINQEQERLTHFLKELEEQGEELKQKSKGFEETADAKKNLLTDLQLQLEGIGQQVDQITQEVNLKQERWAKLQDEELKPIASESASDTPVADGDQSMEDSWTKMRQEKLKLMKDMLESQKRQQFLQQDLIQLKKSMQRPVDGLASYKDKNKMLKTDLANLQSQLKEIDALEMPQEKVAVQPENKQAEKLVQIRQEIENLKSRKAELGGQIQTDSIPEKKPPMDDEMAFNDRKRLQEHLIQQKKDNRLLQQQLKDLKSEMISLDKKKSKIEGKLKK